MDRFDQLPNAEAIAAYRREFVKNFPDESAESFAYLVDEYVPKNLLKIRLDGQGRLEMGYMLIPKKVVLPQGEQSSLLLYGVTADPHYRGTGVVTRLFPADVARIQRMTPFLFAQSPNWKIYAAFALQDLDEFVYFKTPEGGAEAQVSPANPDCQEMSAVYARCVALAKFSCWIAHDPAEFSRFAKVNLAAGDALVRVPGAFCFYAPRRKEAYALTFESAPALANLVAKLPGGTQFSLHALHAKHAPEGCLRTSSEVCARAFFAPPGAVPFLCNGAN